MLEALDIQLKILQAIPSLLQNFASDLTDDLLTSTVQICFILYASKTAVVSNTAAAAIQQLVDATFEKTKGFHSKPLKLVCLMNFDIFR